MILQKVITKNVGKDIVTPEYLESLGYSAESLKGEAEYLGEGLEGEIWDLGYGYHISTDTEERYADEYLEERE